MLTLLKSDKEKLIKFLSTILLLAGSFFLNIDFSPFLIQFRVLAQDNLLTASLSLFTSLISPERISNEQVLKHANF